MVRRVQYVNVLMRGYKQTTANWEAGYHTPPYVCVRIVHPPTTNKMPLKVHLGKVSVVYGTDHTQYVCVCVCEGVCRCVTIYVLCVGILCA